MMQIRVGSDLRNKASEKLAEDTERALDEADRQAMEIRKRYMHEEIFDGLKSKIPV